MLPLEHSAILLTCIKQKLVFFFLSGRLRQVLLYNKESIYIICIQVSVNQCAGKVYYPNVNCG